MPETIKPEESEEEFNGSSDMHVSGSSMEQAGTASGPAAGTGHEEEALEPLVEVPEGDSISEFAESVVSGLEQARFAGGYETSGPNPDDSGYHSATSGAFFEQWSSSAGEPEVGQGEPEPEAQEASRPFADMGAAPWDAPEVLAQPESQVEAPAQPEEALDTLPEAEPAPWGAMEDPEPETRQMLPETQPDLLSLSEIGLATGSTFASYPESSSADISKHDELAEAVQSALLSIYGDPQAELPRPSTQSLGFSGEPAASSKWSAGSRPAPASSQGDGLTPQDVILNYFDYAPNSLNGNAPAPDRFGAAPYESTVPASLHSRLETAVPQHKIRAPQEGPSAQQTAWAASSQSAQYDGPPSFPVPAGPNVSPKLAAASGPESSRLLGAAAIGLMGGIAIAASLAAFLIYGPHPVTFEIPGIGNLRIDKDEQGYGRATPDEAPREPLKGSAAKVPPEFTSEVITADAFAAAGQPAPLAITIRSQQPFEKTLVSITGIPEGGRLNAGIDAGGGTWLLPPRRLNGLTINLPAGVPDTLFLEAQLLDSNARTPLSPRGGFAIHLKPGAASASAVSQDLLSGAQALSKQGPQPATAFAFNTQTVAQTPQPPAANPGAVAAEASFRTQTVTASLPPQTAAPFQASLVPDAAAAPLQDSAKRRPNPRPEVEDLIREGNKRMREGDILEARQFYQKAVTLGDPDAALAMGRSFDPIYFARLDKKNAEPDAAQAFDWYRKAMDAGAAQTAMVRIENLKHFLNE